MSAKLVRATMILTPRIPSVASLAFLISFRSALMFASLKLEQMSVSCRPIMAAAITPIPPSLATAEASPEREMPIPIPP